jgi:hypothetical protein
MHEFRAKESHRSDGLELTPSHAIAKYDNCIGIVVLVEHLLEEFLEKKRKEGERMV